MKTKTSYREVLKLITQLPEQDFEKLLSVLKNAKSDFITAKQFDKEFLLSAPVMSSSQFKQ
ncbi:MAG: hypothetical protein WBB36_11155, partial [Chitinophagales bacterium]